MRRFFALALVPLVILVGCENPEPATFPVEGTVTMNGKPAVGFTVEMASQEESTRGVNSRGIVQADGKFKLTSTLNGKEKDGAVGGKHKVVVVPPPASSGASSKEILPVPLTYADYNTTPLSFEVKPGESNVNKIEVVK